MLSRTTWLTALLAAADLVVGIALNLDDPNSVKAAAKAVATNLMTFYTGDQPGGTPGILPQPYYWWEAGAMFGSLIDYWFYTGDDTWNNVTTQAMLWQAGPSANFMPANQTRDEGNDDQGFWGMAAMAAAERNYPNPPANEPQWLEMAQAVFNTMAARWDMSSCGGGLRWQIFSFNNGYDYKNTISNGCLFNLAARLAKYTGNQTYAAWADKVWDWTAAVGFMSAQYAFYDGSDDLNNCSTINHLQWTYNAGVYLLGSASMYNFTQDPVWKNRTQGILDAANFFFTDNPKNVMYERTCSPSGTCGVDQRSFKAYLARWMAATTQLAPFTYAAVMVKLRASALAAASTCTGGPQGTDCGLKWYEEKWDGSHGVGEQMSALEVIQSNLVTNSTPPLTNSTGGTSPGNPAAGAGPAASPPAAATMQITTADRVGAGVLTALFSIAVLGTTGWLIFEKQ